MNALDVANAELMLAADADRVELLPDETSIRRENFTETAETPMSDIGVFDRDEFTDAQQRHLAQAEEWLTGQRNDGTAAVAAPTNGRTYSIPQNAPDGEPLWAGSDQEFGDEAEDDSDPQDEREPIPDPVSIGTLTATHKQLRPPVIEGVLRQGETACLNAKAKLRKSWTAYDIALCVAAGLLWLERFKCHKGRVLILDFELHPETLARRIPDVANAMKIPPEEYRDRIDVICMRGRLRNIYELWELFERIQAGQYALVILDALYRVLPPNMSENDNAAMAQVFNAIDRYASMTGAAFLVIHHQTKGDQSGRDVVDVGSGASSFARAVDAHLILRQHEQENHVVLDGALRSWEPLQPITLKWTFPVWEVADDVDPELLKGLKTNGEERQAERDRKGKLELVDVLRGWNADEDGPATPNNIITKSPYGKEKTRRLLALLLNDGDVTRSPLEVKGNPTHEYALSE